MPIVDRIGSIFDTKLEAIGHGVNCLGEMDGGIAKTIKELYPSVYREYSRHCQYHGMRGGDNFTAEAVEYDGPGYRWIMNIASQFIPGPHADYLFLQVGLGRAISTAVRLNLAGIALPQIGCGIGGLEWSKTRPIIEEISRRYPRFTIELWDFEQKTDK